MLLTPSAHTKLKKKKGTWVKYLPWDSSEVNFYSFSKSPFEL